MTQSSYHDVQSKKTFLFPSACLLKSWTFPYLISSCPFKNKSQKLVLFTLIYDNYRKLCKEDFWMLESEQKKFNFDQCKNRLRYSGYWRHLLDGLGFLVPNNESSDSPSTYSDTLRQQCVTTTVWGEIFPAIAGDRTWLCALWKNLTNSNFNHIHHLYNELEM